MPSKYVLKWITYSNIKKTIDPLQLITSETTLSHIIHLNGFWIEVTEMSAVSCQNFLIYDQ